MQEFHTLIYEPNQPIYVLCEGNTEQNYLQELNRYLREQGILCFFKPVNLCGGGESKWKKEFRKLRKNHKRERIVLWIDADCILRTQETIEDFKEQLILHDKHDYCCCNYMNGEDFLVLHMDESIVRKWQAVCEQQGHFSKPMEGAIYMPLVKKLCSEFSNYEKGMIPFKVEGESLKNLFQHNEDDSIKFSSEMASFLRKLLDQQ